MKRLILSLVLLPALLLFALLGASVLPAGALSASDPHNPPGHARHGHDGVQHGSPDALLKVGAPANGAGAQVMQTRYRNPPSHYSSAPKGPQVATFQTVPPTPGITFQVAGQQFVTGADGSTVVVVPQPGTYDLQVITNTYHDPYKRVEFSRWLSESFAPTRQIHLPTKSPVVQVGLDVYELVGQKFVAPDGSPVPPQRIKEFTIRSLQGDAFTFRDGQPRWIPASRVTRRRDGGLDVVPLLYTITSVMVDGSNVVNKAQQQFYAKPNGNWTITLLFYSMQVHAQDALFGFPVGKAVDLQLPNGQIQSIPLDATGTAQATSLARGQYYFQVTGARGFSPRSPVALSKDQNITARVITVVDMGTVFAAGLLIAVGLLLFGKFSLQRARHAMTRSAAFGFCAPSSCAAPGISEMKFVQSSLAYRLFAAAISIMLIAAATPAHADEPPASNPVPTLAYYYIWYDSSSWNRAKTDYPLLGRYSSDDRSVMQQHIEWAKAAGITGFIVSWKSTDVLNRRLQQLTDLAEQDNFKLAIIYQGLDFYRKPLSADRVANDLDYFIKNFASRKPFQLFQKPMVIWSGTWEFSAQDVERVTQSRRNSLLILASEKNVSGYERIATSVDGDAYYWSSVNPDTYSGYQDKLGAMSQAVHARQGLWIPPAAPGFDARMIGGTSVVDRKNGQTFRTQINTAMSSSPDALGIISWNEFSENSYIEPSKNYGSQYLDLLSQINNLPPPNIPNFDSSFPAGRFPEIFPHSRVIALGSIVAMVIAAFVLIARRSHSVNQ